MNKFKKSFAIISAAMMIASVSACSASTTSGSGSDNAAVQEKQKVSLDEQILDIEGIGNARQLGGYVTSDGRKVKNNLLIRAADISAITAETAQKLADEYNVKYVVDLRMGYERDAAIDAEIPGAENIWISVYDLDMSDPVIAQMMKNIKAAGDDSVQKCIECAKAGLYSDLYTNILLSEQGQQGYAQFFDIMLNNKDGAFLWHCTHGKDRTGVAAALILYALGVDEDTIMQDFLLTNEVNKSGIEYMTGELKKRGCDEAIVNDALAMAGVNGEYLRNAFDKVKEKYGSVDDYIRNRLGVSDEEREQLKNMYLE